MNSRAPVVCPCPHRAASASAASAAARPNVPFIQASSTFPPLVCVFYTPAADTHTAALALAEGNAGPRAASPLPPAPARLPAFFAFPSDYGWLAWRWSAGAAPGRRKRHHRLCIANSCISFEYIYSHKQ